MSTPAQDEANLGMDGLTAEERAALAEPEDGDISATQGDLEDKNAAKELADSKEGDDDADNSKTEKTGDVASPAAAADLLAATPAPAAAEPAKPVEAATAEPGATQSAPIYVAEAPADAEANLAEIATKKADLLTQFDDGDLTAKEYQTQVDALAKDERAIERAQDRAQIAVDMESQRQQREWDQSCNSFMAQHAEYKDAELFSHLNETIIAFAKMPRNTGLSGPELLEKAHKAVAAERGTSTAAPTPTPTPAASAKAPPTPALPPNLGSMPSASPNDPGEGRFASLDRLMMSNPEAYEAALAKMSSAEIDAYTAAT